MSDSPAAAGHLHRAAFLDRDGTITRDTHYVGRAEDVELLPGAAEAIRMLNDADGKVVVITNQSGIARGLFTEADYEAVRRRIDELLRASGARIDATYHCPHHPEFTGPCDCRKPGRLLYERAAHDLQLDPARSLFAGDRWHDVAAARTFGGLGILVPSPETPTADRERAAREAVVCETLGDAIARFL